MPLLAMPPIVPETWVPWPCWSCGVLSPSTQSWPGTSSEASSGFVRSTPVSTTATDGARRAGGDVPGLGRGDLLQAPELGEQRVAGGREGRHPVVGLGPADTRVVLEVGGRGLRRGAGGQLDDLRLRDRQLARDVALDVVQRRLLLGRRGVGVEPHQHPAGGGLRGGRLRLDEGRRERVSRGRGHIGLRGRDRREKRHGEQRDGGEAAHGRGEQVARPAPSDVVRRTAVQQRPTGGSGRAPRARTYFFEQCTLNVMCEPAGATPPDQLMFHFHSCEATSVRRPLADQRGTSSADGSEKSRSNLPRVRGQRAGARVVEEQAADPGRHGVDEVALPALRGGRRVSHARRRGRDDGTAPGRSRCPRRATPCRRRRRARARRW